MLGFGNPVISLGKLEQGDLSSVNFGATVDEQMGEVACGAGGCELV